RAPRWRIRKQRPENAHLNQQPRCPGGAGRPFHRSHQQGRSRLSHTRPSRATSELTDQGSGKRACRFGLKPKRRHQEFLAFLKQIERAYRDVLDTDGQPVELHLVMDNYAAHKHTNVKAWLANNPRFVVHFTPTHASWMNLVEVWFGIVERQ